MKRLLAIASIGLLIAVTLAYAKPYGEYRKAACEWCERSNVRLSVHHIISQAECKRIGRLDLINDPDNLVTLCDPIILRSSGCHFVFHKRNWKNNVPEIRVLFKSDNSTGR